MRSNTLTGIALIFLSSCAGISLNTGKKERPLQPHQKVEALVNEEKLKEAREAAQSPKVPAYMGIKRVDASEKCRPVIDECNSGQLESQKVRQCLVDLEQSCEKKYLTQKYQEEFETKDKCEEARLLEKEGTQTSSTCHVRYLGDTKKITAYQATAMQNTYKRILTFKEESSCFKATSEGYTYHPFKEQPITYSPIGSSQPIRFIKNCEKNQITICEQYKQGEQFISDLL